MRALADDAEILSKLLRIKKLTVPLTTPVTAALTADAAVDDDELDFLKTGFTLADWVLVDTGTKQSAYRLGTIPAADEPIPITRPADFAHLTGAVVKKLSEIDMGYIEEGSATLSGSSSTASVGAANASGRIWQSDPDIGDLGISWSQRAASLENMASMYGMDESLIKGTGVTADPYRLMVHPDTMGKQLDFAYLLSGRYKNTKTLYMLLLNPTPTISVNSAFGAKNAPMTCQVGCLYTHKLVWVE